MKERDSNNKNTSDDDTETVDLALSVWSGCVTLNLIFHCSSLIVSVPFPS